MGIAVEILLLCALELEICLGVKKYPPVVGERRKKAVAGTRVNPDVIGDPMIFTVVKDNIGVWPSAADASNAVYVGPIFSAQRQLRKNIIQVV